MALVNAQIAEHAQTFVLEDDLRNSWRRSAKTVYKDLPRLAARTTIEERGVYVLRSGRPVKPVKGSAEPKLPDSVQDSRRSSMSLDQKARTELIYNTLKRTSGAEKTLRRSIDDIFGPRDKADDAETPKASDAAKKSEPGEDSADADRLSTIPSVPAADADDADSDSSLIAGDVDPPFPATVSPRSPENASSSNDSSTAPPALGRVTSAVQVFEAVARDQSASGSTSPKSAEISSELNSLRRSSASTSPKTTASPANNDKTAKVTASESEALPNDEPPLVPRSSTTPASYLPGDLESPSFSAKFIEARRLQAAAALATSTTALSPKNTLDKPRGTIAVTVSKNDNSGSAPSTSKHSKSGSFDRTTSSSSKPPDGNRLSIDKLAKGANRRRSNSHAQPNRSGKRRGSASLPTRIKPKEIEAGLTLKEAMSLREPSMIENEAINALLGMPHELKCQGMRRSPRQSRGPDPRSSISSDPLDDEDDKGLEPLSTFDAIRNVLITIANYVETPEVTQHIVEELDRLGLDKDAYSDFEIMCSKLFTNTDIYPSESKTMKILQAVTQNMIFPAMFKFHTTMLKGRQMKDVRDNDGWKVLIEFGRTTSVTHRRWMQSLEPPDSPKYHRLRWEIQIKFAEDYSDITAVMLRSLKLVCHPKMHPTERSTLERELLGGNVIL